MSKHIFRSFLAAATTITALTQIVGVGAAPQARERCFQQTGFCVSGAILDYWERNGGLPVFGYPISAQRNETIEGSWNGPTQWFERDRLEDHSNENKGVLAGRLGALYLETRGTPPQKGIDMPYNPDCTFFNETKYNACGAFLRYWKANGGLARFGYPLGDPVDEVLEGKTYQVQYFERRRLELHPENAGTPYDVQLGLLGRDLFAASGDAGLQTTYRTPSWEIRYPSTMLRPEVLESGTVIFISNDRSTFIAVDSYVDQGIATGNTGEGLRNRARIILAEIYGRDVSGTDKGIGANGRWQTGVRFTTEGGSKGEAVYEQAGASKGNLRVTGVLFGYKAADEARLRPMLEQARASFAAAPDQDQVLINYFSLLYAGRYGEAANMYGGSLDLLRQWNPDVKPDDTFSLFQRGCTQNGLVCLPVRRIVQMNATSASDRDYRVEFTRANSDGGRLELGAQTDFAYSVKQIGGIYKVMGLPQYAP